jgi:hypothetical protein
MYYLIKNTYLLIKNKLKSLLTIGTGNQEVKLTSSRLIIMTKFGSCFLSKLRRGKKNAKIAPLHRSHPLVPRLSFQTAIVTLEDGTTQRMIINPVQDAQDIIAPISVRFDDGSRIIGTFSVEANESTIIQTDPAPSAPPIQNADFQTPSAPPLSLHECEECCICSEKLDSTRNRVILRPCNHDLMCAECIFEWRGSGSGLCPLCNSKINGVSPYMG